MLLRKRVVTTIAVTAVATLAIGAGLGLTSIASIGGIKEKIKTEQQAIDTRYAMHRYIRQEAAKINETRDRLRTLSDMALVEGSELDLITALETTARESDVKQEISLETANQAEISSWEKLVPLTLKVSGAYPSFISYLRRLDRLDYLINISSLNIVQDAGSRFSLDSDGNVRAELRALVYWTSGDRPDFLLDQEILPDAEPTDETDNQ